MNNKDKKEIQRLTLRDFVVVCVGIVLISLAVIGSTNQTVFGEFITYSTAYLFGVFYPFVLLFIIIFGIRLIYSKNIFPIKGYGLFWVGMIFLSITLLAFGSFSLYLSDTSLTINNLLDIYSNRVIAFARYPFKVDSFTSLGGMGGGIIGTFLVSLFSKSWGTIGIVVFYSVLLAFSVFLIVYKPLRNAVIEMKRRKASRVDYLSPYQKKKGTGIEEAGSDLTGDFPSDWREKNNTKVSPTPAGEIGNNSRTSIEPIPQGQDALSINQGGFASGSDTYIDTTTRVRENPLIAHPDGKTATPVIGKPTDKSSAYQGTSDRNNIPAPSAIASDASRFHDDYENEGSTYEVLRPKPTYIPPTPPVINDSDNPSDNRDNNFTSSYSDDSHLDNQGGFADDLNPAVASQGGFNSQNNPLKQTPSYDDRESQPETKPISFAFGEQETKTETEPQNEEENEEESQFALAQQYFDSKRAKKASEIQAVQAEKDRQKAKLYQYVSSTPKTYNYKLPDDSLLEDKDDSDKIEINRASANEKAGIINQSFVDFGIQAKVVSFTIGASVTRFDVQMEPGVKSEKLSGVLNDLQIALNGDKSVRIETVVEGKNTSGIEIGNKVSMAVPFKSAFRFIEKDNSHNLLIPIGKDIDGKIITYPLNEMPHLLVAGTTGSGKSVLVQCMIMTLIMRNYPNQLKLMLIDPKQVEFAKYDMEPHLFCPIITDPYSAATALKKLCEEMDRRYSLLRNNHCVKIEAYREARSLLNNSIEELPDIVCVIDEFAELMNSEACDNVAVYVQRLCQKARAAGIYLIIATQRPSKDVIPMVIKANINSRIALCCASGVDSRVILDEMGAETLLGRGDLLFRCPGRKSLIRAQSAFITENDMEHVIQYLKMSAGVPNYDADFLDLSPKEENQSEVEPNPEDIYDEIKEFTMYTGIVAKSALVRNFSISIVKADQYIARMRQDGIVQVRADGKNVVVKRITRI